MMSAYNLFWLHCRDTVWCLGVIIVLIVFVQRTPTCLVLLQEQHPLEHHAGSVQRFFRRAFGNDQPGETMSVNHMWIVCAGVCVCRAWEQMEVTCARNTRRASVLWNVEVVVDSRRKSSKTHSCFFHCLVIFKTTTTAVTVTYRAHIYSCIALCNLRSALYRNVFIVRLLSSTSFLHARPATWICCYWTFMLQLALLFLRKYLKRSF